MWDSKLIWRNESEHTNLNIRIRADKYEQTNIKKHIWTSESQDTNLNKTTGCGWASGWRDSFFRFIWRNEAEQTNLNKQIWANKSEQTDLKKRIWSNLTNLKKRTWSNSKQTKSEQNYTCKDWNGSPIWSLQMPPRRSRPHSRPWNLLPLHPEAQPHPELHAMAELHAGAARSCTPWRYRSSW